LIGGLLLTLENVMGEKLTGFYEQVGREIGMEGRMKLAMLVKISSLSARNAEDSPANIKLFETAIAKIRKG
jgi:hypothetical protein